MSTESPTGKASARTKRAEAVRNQQTLLSAAAKVFVTSGVDAPIRQIAAEAGVGMGTIYPHFPTRADLVTAVYRHQIEACAEAGPSLLAGADSPFHALRQWIDLFVDFLVTNHGLADRLTPPRVRRGFRNIHAHLACPTRVPKPRRAGPGRPPGAKNKHRAPRYDVGKTVKRPETLRAIGKPGRSW